MAKIPLIVMAYREEQKGIPPQKLCDTYFRLLNKIEESWKSRHIDQAAMYCSLSLSLIEPLVKSEMEEYGSFAIGTIPAIELGLKLNAVRGAKGQIANIRDLVDFIPQLWNWKENVAQAYVILDLSQSIHRLVGEEQGILQCDLKKKLAMSDGRLISNTVHYMECCNLINRTKSGKTYALSIK